MRIEFYPEVYEGSSSTSSTQSFSDWSRVHFSFRGANSKAGEE